MDAFTVLTSAVFYFTVSQSLTFNEKIERPRMTAKITEQCDETKIPCISSHKANEFAWDDSKNLINNTNNTMSEKESTLFYTQFNKFNFITLTR